MRESICDGTTLSLSSLAEAANGEPAVFMDTWDEPESAMQPHDSAVYGEGVITYLDAAKKNNLPLYCADVRIRLGEDQTGDQMLDYHWQQDGSLLLINQASIMTASKEFTLAYVARMYEVATKTGEIIEDSRKEIVQPLAVPVNPVLATSMFKGGMAIGDTDFTLEQVTLKQTTMGIYADIEVTAQGVAGLTPEKRQKFLQAASQLALTDDRGAVLPSGMSLSGMTDDSGFPTLLIHKMFSADAMPETVSLATMEYAPAARATDIVTLRDYADE